MSPCSGYFYQTWSHGLPGEEYSNLRRRDRLESHLKHRANRDTYVAQRSDYGDSGLSQGERFRVSEVRSATRAALGGSFDFTNDGYERSCRRGGEYERSSGWFDDEPRSGAVPKKYLDEFDKRWHEDDEDNDPDQYLADHTHKAPWRDHVLLERSRLHVEPTYSRGSRTNSGPRRVDSGYGSEYRRPVTPPRKSSPLLASKFSFESRKSFDSYEEPSRSYRYLERFQHH